MRIDDRLLGAILVIAGVVIWRIAAGFPMMAGLAYGPGFFPTIAAAGLAVCGVVIAVSGQFRATAAAAPPAPSEAGPRTGALLRGAFLRPFAIAVIVVFFALALQPLGFHVAATLAVAAAAFVFGAGPLGGIVLALAAAFGTHAVFYSMLRVPLPWGVMTPFAW